MAALILGLFSKALIASSLFFPIRIGSTVPKCQKLCIRLVVGTARIFTLGKQIVDCMTEKLNILRRSRVTVTSLISLRSWRDFARECFCFGREAVNTSGQAVRGLVKSRVEEYGGSTARSPAPESRQLRSLALNRESKVKPLPIFSHLFTPSALRNGPLPSSCLSVQFSVYQSVCQTIYLFP